MTREEELKILMNNVKWNIKNSAEEFKTSGIDKDLLALKEHIKLFDKYNEELKSLK